MLKLTVKSTSDYTGHKTFTTQFIRVSNEVEANRWLDAIASHQTILEVSLV